MAVSGSCGMDECFFSPLSVAYENDPGCFILVFTFCLYAISETVNVCWVKNT